MDGHIVVKVAGPNIELSAEVSTTDDASEIAKKFTQILVETTDQLSEYARARTGGCCGTGGCDE